MRISKRQLRILIREVKGSTKKYDEDSALKGGQSNLPDALQKGIIDKAVEDREDREEEDREERNESVKITKRHLRRIVKEELAGVSEEGDPTSWSNQEWWAFAEEKGLIDPYDDGHRNVSAVAGLKQRTLDAYNAGENWEDAYVQHF